jgi:hypothetical protein
MPEWWSWLLTGVALFVIWLAGRTPWGWLAGIASEALWLAYALATHQWGFIVNAAAFAVVFALNWRNDPRRRGSGEG